MSQSKFKKYKDSIPLSNKLKRKFWQYASLVLFRPFSGKPFNKWRNFILRLFGAKIGKGSVVYASAKILAPWNLSIGEETCIGPYVEFHLDKTIIGSKVTISQKSYICTGSHEISSLNLPYISNSIIIEDFVWIGADSFIAMGVTIGTGAIVGARSSVFKNVDSWMVVGGNPAKLIKERKII
jgi:putative colanic acid biosynthesis acetyltransferase WcaF